ncbi:hypothetical protein EGW08_018877, partial [Elysia chlorotica]
KAIAFPKTVCSLWDKSATGNSVFLHMGYYRKPKVCIPEKILRLIQHQCENYSQIHHMLIGSLVIEEDGEGVQFQVDRVDSRNKKPHDGSGLAPGDLLIPLEVSNNSDKERSGSVEDYHCAIRRLQSRCCSKASVDLCEFVLLRGWGSYYSNAHSSVVHLDFDMVTMETVFKATPIPPVPILLTALSKNLAGPMSLSQMQGTTKTGYLSMDHTRKLLLILESDPKACSLPLIGIWVSGAEFVQHPFVWASCLRYIHNTHLQDRVCLPPNEFLLVVYTPLHSRPEFYQVLPTSGTCDLQFQLRTGHEVTNMTKSLSAPSQNFTEVELDAFEGGTKMQLFDAAKAEHGLDLSRTDLRNGNTSMPEDIEPRCVPTPHMERVPSIRPMVPDVSILWAEPAHLQQPSSSSAQFSNQPAASHSTHHAELKNYYHPPRSSHFSPVNTAQQMATSVPNVHSSAPSSSPHQLYTHSQAQSGQILVSGTNFYPRNTVPGNVQTFTRNPNMYQQNVVDGAFTPQNFRHHLSEAPQSSVSVTPQTLYNNFPSAAPASYAHPSLSSSGYQSETTQNLSGPQSSQTFSAHSGSQQSPMGGYNASRNVNQFSPSVNITQAPTHSKNFVGSHMGMPQSVASSSNSPNLPPTWPTQTANSQTNSKTHPILTTVVEESSTSQSSSSSSVPSSTSQMQSGLNGNILALSSQSLGFNSTRGNRSSNSNNSAGTCQSSDDDDSGLSITPDQVNPLPVQHPLPGACQSQGATAKSATSPPFPVNHNVTSSSTASAHVVDTKSGSGLDSVRWDEVPPAVRALLEQQSEQLKVLQQQIQMLLLNQSQQSALSASQSQQARSTENPSSSPSSAHTQHLSSSGIQGQQQQLLHNHTTASHNKTTETCSIGVNTTILDDRRGGHNSMESHSVQTSPVKTFGQQNFFISPVLGDRSNNCNSNEGMAASGNTPVELQHRSCPPISSTTYETPAMTPLRRSGSTQSPKLTKGDTSTKDENVHDDQMISQKDLVSAMDRLPIQDQTMNTVASELVVDMPDYASTVHEGMGMDQSCNSPPSVSKCYGPDQDDSYSTVAEDAMDPKQYYSQLMNNIQMFLTNDKTCDVDMSEDHSKSGPALEVGSPIKSGFGGSANSSMIPRINYVSMMLGSSVCGSPVRGGSPWDLDPGQSMEINAMAMKYLSDEQLTQMAMLRQRNSSSHRDEQDRKTARALQMVMQRYCPNPDKPSTDVSRLGISLTNMTMATQKYLEKHGLLDNGDSLMMTPGRGHGGGNELSTFDHSLKLRTDFSMAQSSYGNHVSNSKKDGSLCEPSTPVKSPLRQNVINTFPRHAEQDSPHSLNDYHKAPQSSPPMLNPPSSKQKVPSVNTKRVK